MASAFRHEHHVGLFADRTRLRVLRSRLGKDAAPRVSHEAVTAQKAKIITRMPADPGSPRAVLSRDTDRAAERLQVALWRRMAAGAKLTTAGAASTATLRLSLAGIRIRAPHADENAHHLTLARIRLGAELVRQAYSASDPRNMEPMTIMDPVDVALTVAAALDRCGVRYVVGGSLASSVSGEPRSTVDVDVMVDIAESTIACVIEALGPGFYADPDAFARAVRLRSSVNVIHLPTATKVDLFVMGATPIEPEQMDRRMKVQVSDRAGAELYVYTAEDILLQKLRWYRLGNEASDRQWRDILGIIAVQADALDLAYLRGAAARIDVPDLLSRALADAGPPPQSESL